MYFTVNCENKRGQCVNPGTKKRKTYNLWQHMTKLTRRQGWQIKWPDQSVGPWNLVRAVAVCMRWLQSKAKLICGHRAKLIGKSRFHLSYTLLPASAWTHKLHKCMWLATNEKLTPGHVFEIRPVSRSPQILISACVPPPKVNATK